MNPSYILPAILIMQWVAVQARLRRACTATQLRVVFARRASTARNWVSK